MVKVVSQQAHLERSFEMMARSLWLCERQYCSARRREERARMLRGRASAMGQGDNMVELFRGPGELEPRRANKDAGSRVL